MKEKGSYSDIGAHNRENCEAIAVKFQVRQCRRKLKRANAERRVAKSPVNLGLAMVAGKLEVGWRRCNPVDDAVLRVRAAHALGNNGRHKGAAKDEKGSPVPPGEHLNCPGRGKGATRRLNGVPLASPSA